MINAPDLLGLTDAELLRLAPTATHQHKKGGLYRMLGPARWAEGGLRVSVSVDVDRRECGFYEHLYPHERGLWMRAQSELDDATRFRPLDQQSVDLEREKFLEAYYIGVGDGPDHSEGEAAWKRFKEQ